MRIIHLARERRACTEDIASIDSWNNTLVDRDAHCAAGAGEVDDVWSPRHSTVCMHLPLTHAATLPRGNQQIAQVWFISVPWRCHPFMRDARMWLLDIARSRTVCYCVYVGRRGSPEEWVYAPC